MTDTPINPMNQAMNPTEPSKMNTSGMLRLFVYGTLKRGFWNHDRFCLGVRAVEDAVVRGRLFETSSGIPVLEVPEENILAHGTTHPLADVATQARVTAHMPNPDSTPDRLPKNAVCAPWAAVYGELLTFDDPETRASRPSTGWRGSIPCLRATHRQAAVPASTAECWFRRRPTGLYFRSGSMWVRTRSRAGLSLSAGPTGLDSHESVTFG